MNRFIREVVVGAKTSMQPDDKKHQEPSAIVQQRHEFEESLQILRGMRKIGGVRRVAKGKGDNGAPVGPDFINRVDEISARLTIDGKRMVHTLDEVAEHVGQGVEYDRDAGVVSRSNGVLDDLLQED